MKKFLIVATLALASLFGGMSAANGAGQLCYDVQVNAQGSPVVAEAGCQELP